MRALSGNVQVKILNGQGTSSRLIRLPQKSLRKQSVSNHAPINCLPGTHMLTNQDCMKESLRRRTQRKECRWCFQVTRIPISGCLLVMLNSCAALS